MQVLETIQEYTPIKHGLSYLSSWIGKGYTYGSTTEVKSDSVAHCEASPPNSKDLDQNIDLNNASHLVPSETSSINGLVSRGDKEICIKCSNPLGTGEIENCICETRQPGVNNTDLSSDNPQLASTPARISCDKSDLKTPDIRVDPDVLKNNTFGYYENSKELSSGNKEGKCGTGEPARLSDRSQCVMCTSDYSTDDPLSNSAYLSDTDANVASSSRVFPRENAAVNSPDVKVLPQRYESTRRFPKLLTTWHKRHLKARKRKQTIPLEGKIIFRRFRLPENTGESCSLQRNSRSKSESDLNGAVASSRLSEASGDSDRSAQSLNTIQDNNDDDYVDIDFCHKGSISGSSCRDTSISSESLDLSSDWTEFTLSVSETSIGEECRESDHPDTESCRSQDLSLNLQTHRSKKKRWRKNFLHGQAVNEFVDKECFCCHCVIL